jgi:hypothetical protein
VFEAAGRRTSTSEVGRQPQAFEHIGRIIESSGSSFGKNARPIRATVAEVLRNWPIAVLSSATRVVQLFVHVRSVGWFIEPDLSTRIIRFGFRFRATTFLDWVVWVIAIG